MTQTGTKYPLFVYTKLHSSYLRGCILHFKSTYEWHLNDLEPGTAYMLRFVVKEASGTTIASIGNETVFDTKPVGCAGDDDKKGGCGCVVN